MDILEEARSGNTDAIEATALAADPAIPPATTPAEATTEIVEEAESRSGNSDAIEGMSGDAADLLATIPVEMRDILEKAISGDFAAVADPAVLLATTTEGNTFLHIASMISMKEDSYREQFCKNILSINGSLLTAVNRDGETPLLTAVIKGHEPLARSLLRWCRYLRLSDAVLKQDTHGCNALHYALRGGRRKLALELIEAEPTLSRAVNKRNESPMFIALTSTECADVFDKLLKTPKSSNKGGYGHNAQRPSLSMREATATTGGQGRNEDLAKLVEAATAGNVKAMRDMAPAVLSQRTPVGNTCLHIASIHDREPFCKDVLSMDGSLLDAVNADGETPLLVAVTNGHISLATYFLSEYMKKGLSEALTKQDKNGCNALHHTIQSGYRELALELIKAAPSLSHAVNRYGESPMFIAAMRDYRNEDLVLLLNTNGSSHVGPGGNNALHAAVRNGNKDFAVSLVQARPQLAREEDLHKETPVHLAVRRGLVDVLIELLKHDQSLGYLVCSDGTPLLNIAARRGYVSAAKEILDRCPDTPYASLRGWTCLHEAVDSAQMEFVNFVLTSQKLRKLVNMRNGFGETALHVSVRKCMPKMLAALLRHPDIDVTALTNKGAPASWLFDDAIKSAKSLQWNEVSMLLLNADPKRETNIYNLHKEIKDKVIEESRNNVKSLTETYTRNTSIVAILMASITFTAAFTLSGWYRSDAARSKGLPDMAKKFAFQAFLIFDTLAMCCSLSVAFICVIARWEDFEFLLHYRSFTKGIMLLAYISTTTAFATGLYTALAPRLLGWAIAICCLPVSLPILTILLGKWPVLKLWFRLGRSFKSNLLDMV